MTPSLRLLCVVGAALTFALIVNRVRRSRVRVEDSLFWVGLSLALLVIALFPQIPYFLSSLLGFQSPSNFVFLAVITILLMREFSSTLKLSQLNARLNELAQEQALATVDEEGARDNGAAHQA